jgi:SnoaL-like domain
MREDKVMSSQPMPSKVTTQLPPVVREYFAAVNAFDTDRVVDLFASDGYVNDVRREMWGPDAIRKWVEKEIVGDHVTMEVREVVDNYGDMIVRAKYDGTYDKTNLPDELVLSNYFSVRDHKIVSLTIIFNEPSPY